MKYAGHEKILDQDRAAIITADYTLFHSCTVSFSRTFGGGNILLPTELSHVSCDVDFGCSVSTAIMSTALI